MAARLFESTFRSKLGDNCRKNNKMAPEISVSEYFGNADIEKPDIQREDRTTILHASQVSYGYEKGKPVLRDFDWKPPRGSIYCIMGSNGSGKSTALKVMVRHI